MSRFAALRALEANWDGDGAKPIAEAAIDAAGALIDAAARRVCSQRAAEPWAIAGLPSGGVVLEWRTAGGACLAVDIDPDGRTFGYLSIEQPPEASERIYTEADDAPVDVILDHLVRAHGRVS